MRSPTLLLPPLPSFTSIIEVQRWQTRGSSEVGDREAKDPSEGRGSSPTTGGGVTRVSRPSGTPRTVSRDVTDPVYGETGQPAPRQRYLRVEEAVRAGLPTTKHRVSTVWSALISSLIGRNKSVRKEASLKEQGVKKKDEMTHLSPQNKTNRVGKFTVSHLIGTTLVCRNRTKAKIHPS